MTPLCCKTRGHTAPQGKPRVYFAAHPDDYSLFDQIAATVLTVADCAVYACEDPDGKREGAEHRFLLSEMHLFVIPITESFLAGTHAVYTEEFLFARKTHIPILPLLYDKSLAERFNAISGGLECLMPLDEDPTAIPFGERLSRFLDAVLVKDTLAARVREAFDAYIFLSYRKKDRYHANTLMRTIHKNEALRDVAIWYDEHLTPGENWSHNIENALDKSALFALAVTPNLVNEDNYVMHTEYPMAKQKGKKILAAECVPTDRDSLLSSYEGLGRIVDADKQELLDAMLLDALMGVTLRENDTDPEHSFLIGIAYLAGIDVEKDTDRATELITRAAETNYPEAMAKLVSMYTYGEGVAIDYDKALFWQERLAFFLEGRYVKAPSAETCEAYFSAMEALGALLADMRYPDREAAVWEQLRRELHKMPEECPEERRLFLSEEAARRLAVLAEEQGQGENATLFYTEALAYATTLAEHFDSPRARRHLAISHLNFGSQIAEDDPDAAFLHYQSAQREARKAIAEEDSHAAHLTLVQVYRAMAALMIAQSDRICALDYLERAVAECRQVHRTHPSVYVSELLASALDALAEWLCNDGKTPKGIEVMLEALILRESIVNTAPTRDNQYIYTVSLREAAERLADEGAVEDAIRLLETARTLSDELCQVPTCRLLLDRAVILDRLGALYAHKQSKEKYALLQEALALCESLAAQYDYREVQQTLAQTLSDLAEFHIALGESESAQSFLARAVDVCRKLIAETGTRDDDRRLLASALAKLGSLTYSTEALEEALSLYRPLTEKGFSKDTLMTASLLAELAMRYAGEDLDTGRRLYEEAVALYTDLLPRYTPLMTFSLLFDTVFTYAEVLIHHQEYADAEVLLKRNEAMFDRIAASLSANENRTPDVHIPDIDVTLTLSADTESSQLFRLIKENAAYCIARLGDLYQYVHADPDSATRYYHKMLTILQTVTVDDLTEDNLELFGSYCLILGELASTDQPALARIALEKSITLLKALLKTRSKDFRSYKRLDQAQKLLAALGE
ncbi:MAG: TIR domain-containing protein [Clostridia bacterium]|nr:TIR domain-containing protein [Clostridia bacterium]